jgi:ABC-type uncharacterized transport system substrate-binding protein
MPPTPHNLSSAGQARRTRGLCALTAAVWTVVSVHLAPAQQVFVVLGGESEPYRAAAQACVESLDAWGIKSATLPLSSLKIPRAPGGDDLYLAVGSRAAESLAGQLPADTPLVYCMISLPEAATLPARRRTTGVTTTVPASEQFRLIESTTPGARRIGVLHRASSETSAFLLESARAELPRGWSIEAVDLDAHKSPAAAIDKLIAARVDAIWTIPDPAVYDGAVVKSLLNEALR